jgi:hypothetical protein
MNSADVSTLKNELKRFEPKPCRPCQLILAFGVLVFLISLTIVLFSSKGVTPDRIIPVESVPRDVPLTRTQEREIMGDLRAFANSQTSEIKQTQEHIESPEHRVKKEMKVVVDPIKTTP